ncbi:uncharacterized protein METZ01_LOCUS432797, partial [marine metagenome]
MVRASTEFEDTQFPTLFIEQDTNQHLGCSPFQSLGTCLIRPGEPFCYRIREDFVLTRFYDIQDRYCHCRLEKAESSPNSRDCLYLSGPSSIGFNDRNKRTNYMQRAPIIYLELLSSSTEIFRKQIGLG